MTVIKKALVVAALGMFCCGLVWLISKEYVQAQPQSEVGATPYKPFHEELEENALVAKDGDERATRKIAEQLFLLTFRVNIPPKIAASMKDRLVRAEINYHKGASAGIREANVVRMVNEFVDKFNLPDYARTTPGQVRILRAGHAYSLPNFMASKTHGSDNQTDQLLSSLSDSEMSPLQAFYLALTLMQQKLLNEEFQVTPDEWNALEPEYEKRFIKRLEAYRADKEKSKSGKSEVKGVLMGRSRSFKEEEIEKAIARGVRAMSLRDLVTLGDTALDTLGVAR